MKGILNLRKVISKLIQQEVGSSKAGERLGLIHANEIMALPAQVGANIQNLDPNSASYGKFYFIAGYSKIGGEDIIA